MTDTATDTGSAPAILDLLRHGTVTGPASLRGRTDDPLDEQGWQQMRQALSGRGPWQAVYSSPLRRCREFAEQFAGDRQLPLTLDPDWQEIDFGGWDGLELGELQRQHSDRLSAFWRDPERHPPPGGERLGAFGARIQRAFETLHHQLPVGQRALLVTHAGAMRVLLCQVLGLPLRHQFRFELPHASCISIVLDPEQPRLLFGPAAA